MPYCFSLIRFVPDPARGEFVNIGAIAGDDEGDWDVRWISNYKRAKALDSGGFLSAAKAFTAVLDEKLGNEDSLFPDEQPSLSWLSELSVDLNNLVQVTEPAPVAADSAEAALDLVFDRLVVDPAKATFRFKKKSVAQKATRQTYRDHDVPRDAVIDAPRVVSGSYDFAFDFAVHNGRAVQLAQCWSFELPNQTELRDQVKAWAWMVHEIRDRGGELLADQSFEVPGELDIAAIYVPPRDGESSPAFKEARGAFKELRINAAPVSDANSVGAAAAARLGASAH